MAANKKFNVRHGLSAGAGNGFKDVVDNEGIVLDVGLLSDLKTADQSNTVAAINELYDSIELSDSMKDTGEPMGVLDREQSVISFDNSTKTFTIEPSVSASEFVIWTKGVRRVFDLAQSVSLGASPATGMYYIYFNPEGELAVKTSFYDLQIDTPVSYVYWNANTGVSEFVADERHGVVLDWATHEYLHRTRGAVIAQGFSLGSFTTTGDGTNNSHAQVDLGNGVFFDEDLKVEITHSTTPTDGTFTQILQAGAEIPVFYQEGASGSWVKNPATKFPMKFNSGERIRFNTLSGGNWITQQVGNNRYTITWIVATNDIYSPVLGILNQAEYTNIGGAEAALFEDLALPGFPILEFRPLWKLIIQTSNDYTNTPKSRLVRALDIRKISAGTPGQIASHHGLLTGLSEDDHPQYVHTELDRTISANHTITGDLALSGGVKDRFGSLGMAEQYLASTGLGVEWKYTSTKNVLFVSKDGNDSNSGTSLQNAKATIKSALIAADKDTVIKVSAGEYTEDNPLIMPEESSIVGDSLREVTIIPQNNGDLFYVDNGCYVSDVSFVGQENTGAIFSFNPSNPPYISQSPYIQNCTNFVPGSQGLRIDGDHCLGPFKSMVVDSYTQFNQGGIGAQIKNEAYAQLVSMFTICCDTAIQCESGGGCDLTNSNSSFGNFGLIADGVSDLKYRGTVIEGTAPETNIVEVNLSTPTYNVSAATYNNITGQLTITTSIPHDLEVGMDVEIQDLTFNCDSGGGPSNQAFPSGAYGYIFTVKAVPSSSQIVVFVGNSDIVHTYVSGGTVKNDIIRPFDGQVIFFNELYYQVYKINIIDGGSGYLTPPFITFSGPSESWGIAAEAVAQVSNGIITSIDIISAGRGYSSTPPSITISPPAGGGSPAAVSIEMAPTYYLVQSSEEVSTNSYKIVLKNTMPFSLSVSDTAYFYKQSRLLASGHSFEYIGSGTNIDTAPPRKGGVPIQENETISKDGGVVIYTSTDHSGNFRIGDGVVIDQTLGRISGEFYSRSLFSTMTPFILALGA